MIPIALCHQLRRVARCKAIKPRLAVCISAFQYGGQGTVVEEELNWLKDDFEITLVSEKIRRPVPDGIRFLEAPSWSVFPRLNPRLPELLRSFDLIHCLDSLGMMLAAKVCGKPYVVSAMGMAPIRLRSSARGVVEALATVLLYPRLYRAASSVVAISSYVASWARRFARVEPQVILLGVNPPDHCRYARPPSRKLLYVGEISRPKGIRDLVRALPVGPHDVSLDLVGAGDRVSFKNAAERLGLGARVRFHGVLEEDRLWEMYRDAFCTVSASLWEGFGLPLVEGFRVGRPAIARNQGGMREIVELSGAGVMFRELQEFGQCVEAVTDEWEPLSQRALDFARAHTWGKTFGAYRQLFNQILGLTTGVEG